MNVGLQNPMLYIDGYKLDHRRQYPKGTQRVYSNWTPRATRIPEQKEVVFFGLQYFLWEYLMEKMYDCFFNRDKEDILNEYQNFTEEYLGPNPFYTSSGIS